MLKPVVKLLVRAPDVSLTDAATLADIGMPSEEEASQLYPHDVTSIALRGNLPSPEGFEGCMADAIGPGRLDDIRAGEVQTSGEDHKQAAVCLLRLEVDADAMLGAEAQRIYSPSMTNDMLLWRISLPEGFGSCIIGRLGQERLDVLSVERPLRAEEMPTEEEHTAAALCLMELNVSHEVLIDQVTIDFIDTTYAVASGETSGSFATGQEADIALSAIDFNNTGGPLLFNHQAELATDGARFLMADSNNNRVLIWNTLPEGNVEPDLVLGQSDFVGNDPGKGRDQMNWPVAVATDGQRVAVADTENHRILIWNSFPTESGQPADLVLQGGDPLAPGVTGVEVSESTFFWPWGVWTDGEKLAITSTAGGGVLIWDQFPTQDDQPADIVLTAGGRMGTPRNILSNGETLIVGEHNPGGDLADVGVGNYIWTSFPTVGDQPFDFYRASSPWLQGDFTEDGKLVTIATNISVWNAAPSAVDDEPELVIAPQSSIVGRAAHWGGDHTGLAIAGGRVYISSGNLNRILVYNSLPTGPDQEPDFAIGSPDLYTNTLETNFIITNGVPASTGDSLFVSSNFEHKLYVWKDLPDESGAYPDIVYGIPGSGFDNALLGDTLVLAGWGGPFQKVFIWEGLPLDRHFPDRVLVDRIGSVQLQQLRGVAPDDRYFYLADETANKVYVWEGIPSQGSEPAFSLDVEGPSRLSSDGTYLAVTQSQKSTVLLYLVEGLGSDTDPVPIGGVGTFNLPAGVNVAEGHLFVGDTGFARVHVWSDIQDALAGEPADIVLGAEDFDERTPEIGRDKLFWPATLFFDGSYLWVGEIKFSNRLLRFSPSE